MPATPTTDNTATPAPAWGAVVSMALCVALLIASEFMPVSLLTPMAEGLRATVGQTGQAISISGLFAVAASIAVTTAAGRLNRKWVLVAMTALKLLSLVLLAAAPNFVVLMIGRALLGVCIGGFWALATAVIMRLVPAADVSRALALMYGGQAIAAAFATPVGSYLGGLFGWREVFWALTPLVAINLIWLVMALPSLPTRQRQDFGVMIGLLKRPYFLGGEVSPASDLKTDRRTYRHDSLLRNVDVDIIRELFLQHFRVCHKWQTLKLA
jgi:predicted MFS family arabinose efflux permease